MPAPSIAKMEREIALSPEIRRAFKGYALCKRKTGLSPAQVRANLDRMEAKGLL